MSETRLTGQIVKILRYEHSGFIRDAIGVDYYFNVKDFKEIKSIQKGQKVRFSITPKYDSKKKKYNFIASDIEVINDKDEPNSDENISKKSREISAEEVVKEFLYGL